MIFWSFSKVYIYILFKVLDVDVKDGKRGIYFPQGPNGRSNGEAYIELESKTEIEKATAHHNEHIGRRYIEGK